MKKHHIVLEKLTKILSSLDKLFKWRKNGKFVGNNFFFFAC